MGESPQPASPPVVCLRPLSQTGQSNRWRIRYTTGDAYHLLAISGAVRTGAAVLVPPYLVYTTLSCPAGRPDPRMRTAGWYAEPEAGERRTSRTSEARGEEEKARLVTRTCWGRLGLEAR